MPLLEFHLDLVSPTFLYGAYQRGEIEPEVRAPSVRGQLRYWFRAMRGAQTTALDHLWDSESATFGSTGSASPVTIRLFAPGPLKIAKVAMLPHRKDSGRPMSEQRAISPGQRVTLQLVTRPGVPLPTDVRHALRLWSLLGGIGKRSRRMFGAVQLTPTQEAIQGWYPQPDSPEALASTITEVVQAAVGASLATYSRNPRFPTLHPDHSWVVVGREGDADPLELNRTLFRSLLRTAHFKGDSFGFATGGRRASPLIAQVRRINGLYYPVLTALRSEPGTRINWTQVRDLMGEAVHTFNGITAWGAWR